MAEPIESTDPPLDHEVLTETAGTPPVATPEPSPAMPPRRHWRWVLGLLLAVTVTGLLVFAGFRYWQMLHGYQTQLDASLLRAREQQLRLQDQLDAANTELAAQQERIHGQEQAFQAQVELLAVERQKVRLQGESLQQTVATAQRRMGGDTSRWMVAEAEYLMRLADRQLRLERDVSAAIYALQSADQRLEETGDPQWVEVRRVLAGEISALQALQLPDLGALAERLNALVRRVDELTLAAPSGAAEVGEAPAQITPREGFEGLLERGWIEIKSLMTIRRHDLPVRAAFPPSQRFYIYQNLRMQLELARSTALRGDQGGYEAAIDKARSWLDDFFAPDLSPTPTFRAELQSLRGPRLTPRLPDVAASLNLLQSRLGRGSAPGPEAAAQATAGGNGP
jgi:uroporphyrin-III C-methyltransferase